MESYSVMWALISLLGLVGVIVIANTWKMNVGLVGFAMAMLLATLGGLNIKTVYSAFNTQLFLRILSLQALIVLARTNGTLGIVGKHFMRLGSGKAIRILPIVLYIIYGISAFFNLGIDSALTPLLYSVAFVMGFENPFVLTFVAFFVYLSFGNSPFNMTGNMVLGYAEAAGYELNLWYLAFAELIAGTIIFFGYYVAFGWLKMKPRKGSELLAEGDNVKMGKEHWLTVCGFAAFVVGNVVLKLDLMVVPIIAVIVLCCLGCGDPKKILQGIPWGVLMMIGGMTIYVSVIKDFGGVELIAGLLAKVGSKILLPPAITLLSGVMSTFSSGTGVVMPTVTAIIPSLIEMMPGVNIQSLYVAMGMGASATGISPFSTLGAQAMAFYASCYNPTPEQERKTLGKLLKYTVIMVVLCTLLGFTGIYGLFGQ